MQRANSRKINREFFSEERGNHGAELGLHSHIARIRKVQAVRVASRLATAIRVTEPTFKSLHRYCALSISSMIRSSM